MELIKIYLTIFTTSIKARMEYKVSFLFYIFSILAFYAGQFGLLFVLLNRFHEIKGWTIGEMIFLYSLHAFAFGFTNLIFQQLINFDKMIVDGEFDRVLVRPLSPLGQVIFSKFEISTVAHLIIGSTALYFGSRFTNIEWTFYKVLMFPVIIMGGVMIAGGIRLIVTSVAFWTLRNRSLVHTVIFSSKEFINYPVNIYNMGMQFFFDFYIPNSVYQLLSCTFLFRPLRCRPPSSGTANGYTISRCYCNYRFNLFLESGGKSLPEYRVLRTFLSCEYEY